MNARLSQLSNQGLVDLSQLGTEQRQRLDELLTDADVAALLNLNSRAKLDGTMDPLSANTRSTS